MEFFLHTQLSLVMLYAQLVLILVLVLVLGYNKQATSANCQYGTDKCQGLNYWWHI